MSSAFNMYTQVYPFAAFVLFILATQLAPSIFCSALTLGGSVKKGFQVSPSQISVQWGSFRPFLISSRGSFSLGFDETVESGYVLAIMYTIRSSSSSNSSELPLNMEMVWSANGDSPSSEEATLSLSQQGSVLLTDASNGTIWSTGTTIAAPTKLSLQDSGSLILTMDSSGPDTPTIMWQSFDHPTDTLLQGQNFTASMRLTSSLRSVSKNSSMSVFLKMEVDGIALYADIAGPHASQLMYWKLNADQETAVIDTENSSIYARMDAMGYLGMYQAENERVSYEVFSTYNSSYVSQRRLKLDADGNLRVYYWGNASWGIDFQAVADDPCALPSACGPFGICNISGACTCAAGGVISNNASAGNASFARVNDSDASQGCVVVFAEPLVDDGCEKHAKVSSLDTSTAATSKGLFMQLVGMDSLFHARTRTQLNATSVEACEVLCRTDCECTAFFYSQGSASKCFLAYQPAELSLVQTGNTDDLAFIRLSKAAMGIIAPYTTVPTQMAKHARSLAVPVTLTIAVLLVVSTVLGLAVWAYRARRLHGEGDLERKAFLSEIPGLPAHVSYKEIEACSANFKRHRSTGALGTVYEGVLTDGARVAIARLSLLNAYDLHDLKLTLASVGGMVHPNLAKLCCYSIDRSNLALCYELPLNGWLDLAALSWEQRIDVGVGVARALAALHGAKMQHGLLSLEAVFVARAAEAKVAGLGLAELVAGGLAAPINLAERPPDLAESADVLQFGIVLTELLSGQRVKNGAMTWRLKWRDAIDKKCIAQLLDPAILGDVTSANDDLLARLATSAGLCLHPSPLQRPSISTVIRILDGSITNLPLI